MVVNFGRNIRFQPKRVLTPGSERELCELLAAGLGHNFRCIGRLHAWSRLVETDDCVLCLDKLNSIALADDGQSVRVGAGCQIKKIIADLNQHGLTLPSLGLIDKQSIAGATATGTHGSGKLSLSGYVQAVRVVHFDCSGQVQAEWIGKDDPRLRAAQCGLGCLGVVTEVELPTRPQYHIEEHFVRYKTLAEVLAGEQEFPLQQFYLNPWRWDYYAQHRREVPAQARSWHAAAYRGFWNVGMDVGLHVLICAIARVLPWGSPDLFFRFVLPRLIPQRWKVVDRSDRQLTMQHEMFRHIEIELFVPRQHLADMFAHVRSELIQMRSAIGPDRYEHHYPICVRRVLPDETLISPSSGGNECWYALSFISYAHPARRQGFTSFASKIATSAAAKFGARPHWGKVCPLPPETLRDLYPHFEDFQRVINELDGAGRFRGSWLKTVFLASR